MNYNFAFIGDGRRVDYCIGDDGKPRAVLLDGVPVEEPAPAVRKFRESVTWVPNYKNFEFRYHEESTLVTWFTVGLESIVSECVARRSVGSTLDYLRELARQKAFNKVTEKFEIEVDPKTKVMVEMILRAGQATQ